MTDEQWVIAPGWKTAHLRRSYGSTMCGREIAGAVEALPHDRRCGQCQRRRGAKP